MRTVKPGFFTSEGIAPGLLLRTRLTFMGLWCYCDDHGRGKDNLRLIRSEVWPLDDDITLDMIEADLGALVRSGHLVRYEVGGSRFLAIQKWHFSQSPNHPQPTAIPDPPSRILVPAPGEKKHCAACWATLERVTDPSVNVPGPFTEQESGYPQSPGETFTERSVNVPGRRGRGVGEGVGEGGEGASATEPPSPRCPRHVNNPTTAPCGGCKESRLAREAWDKAAGSRGRDALMAVRKCPHCDADGQRYAEGTRIPATPYERCDHRPLRSVS
jgi:hypothetical protein